MSEERIGRFELLEQLGSGAMGVVWRARDTRLRREVALKLIRDDRAADRHARERFIREFHTVASLNHPGIATLFEADETPEGRVYCVYEKVDGETLTDRIRRGDLSTEECIDIGVQLADALAAAHAVGVVHRDIKPDNVMVTAEGRVKILDFGLARTEHSAPIAPAAPCSEQVSADEAETIDDAVTRVGALVGTPRYMSPEQAAGAEVDSRTDVFSAGLVLYELATGEAAFTGESIPETLHRIKVQEHRPVRERNPSIDRRLGAVIDRSLSKSVDDRFRSGAELALALRKARKPPEDKRLWWTAAVVAMALVAAVTWFFTRPTLAFSEKDRLLIADVDNRTGEEVFDLALTAALTQDVEQSRYALVYERSLVAEILRRMRQPADAFINEELGRDICRFGGVRALVVPRILSVGEAYELQATLVDPINGRHVETLRVTVKGKEAVLLKGVDELAKQLRKALGESLAAIEENDLPISEHTTSSWEAMQSLVRAQLRWDEGKYTEAATLFERAIEQDPEFMAAYGALGLLKVQPQLLNEPEEGKRLLRKALDLSDNVTEFERLIIGAVNKNFVDGDLEGALADYAMILDLYPDAFSAHNNKGQLLYRLGRVHEALEAFEVAHRIEPSSAIPLWAIAQTRLFILYDAVGAESAARKVVDLHPDSADALHMLAWSYVGQRRFDEAEAGMRKVLEIDPTHGFARPNLAHLLYRRGAAAEAVPIYRDLLERPKPNTSWDTLSLALALRATGDTEEADRLLAERIARLKDPVLMADDPDPDQDGLELVLLLAALGKHDEAKRQMNGIDIAALPIRRMNRLAEVYTLMGRNDDAIAALERAVDEGFRDIFFWSLMPALGGLRDDPRFVALMTRSSDP